MNSSAAGSSAAKDSTYKYLKDVDVSVISNNEDWDGDEVIDDVSTTGWVPIGSSSDKFTGSFNGNGHSISNLFFKRGETHQGLFGYVNNANITDLKLINVMALGGSDSVGALIGKADYSYLANLSSDGVVKGENNSVGGIAGAIYDTDIKNSYSNCDVKGLRSTGGLIGSMYDFSTANSTYATGDVTGTTESHIGGLIGLTHDEDVYVSNSYAEGNVSGGNCATGGLIGYCVYTTVNKTYATGDVRGNCRIGKSIGHTYGSTVSNSYGLGGGASAFIGAPYGSTIINNPSNLCEGSVCSDANAITVQGTDNGTDVAIVSDGVDDYIDTGVIPTSNTKVELFGKLTSVVNSKIILGSQIPDGSRYYLGVTNGDFSVGHGSVMWDSDRSSGVATTSEVKLVVDGNKLYIDDVLVDENPGTLTSSTGALYLFDHNRGGSYGPYNSAFSLQYAKIWDDGSLIRDFVAREDGKLLDEINNVVYSNSGSGNFTVAIPDAWDEDVWNGLGTTTPSLKDMP